MNIDSMLKAIIEEFRKRHSSEFGEMLWHCKNRDNDNVHSLKMLVGRVLVKMGEEVDCIAEGICNLGLLIEGEVVEWRMSRKGSRLVEKYRELNKMSPHYRQVKERDIDSLTQNTLFAELVMNCIWAIGKNLDLNSHKKSEQTKLRKGGVTIGGFADDTDGATEEWKNR